MMGVHLVHPIALPSEYMMEPVVHLEVYSHQLDYWSIFL